MHRRLDWLGRFEDSTDQPPTGPLRLGEIAVQDLSSGATLKGIEAFRLLCRHMPAYSALLPLTYLAPVRKRIERGIGGCADACDVPDRQKWMVAALLPSVEDPSDKAFQPAVASHRRRSGRVRRHGAVLQSVE